MCVEIYFLNAGDSDVAFIKHVAKDVEKWIMIDCSEGVYWNLVKEFIITKGIERLDLVIITHIHYDHCGNILSILNEIGHIIEFWGPNIYIKNTDVLSEIKDSFENPLIRRMANAIITYSIFLKELDKRGTKIIKNKEYSWCNFRDFCIKELYENWNDSEILKWIKDLDKSLCDRDKEMIRYYLENINLNLNRTCLVLKIFIDQLSIIFASDIVGDWYCKIDKNELKTDILKVPHHGYADALSLHLLRLMSPKYLVINSSNDFSRLFDDSVRDFILKSETYYLISGVDKSKKWVCFKIEDNKITIEEEVVGI